MRTHARFPRHRAFPRWVLLAALLGSAPLLVAAAAGAQGAETSVVEGTVVSVEGGEILVDIAGQRGAKAGDVIELWRPVVLRHPVTRKPIRDRFPIGQVTLAQVGEQLSRAADMGALERKAEVGDVAILRRTGSSPSAASPPPATPAAPTVVPGPVSPSQPAPATAAASAGNPAPSADSSVAPSAAPEPPPATAEPVDPKASEAIRVAEMFEALSHSTVVQRINAYEAYVRLQPHSTYAPVLFEEAAMLRRLVGYFQGAALGREQNRPASVERFELPDEALPGVPLTLALRLAGDARPPIVHVRTEGQPSFETFPMHRSGRHYYSVTLPAGRIEEPALELFVEAPDEEGLALPLLGSAERPLEVDVRAITAPERAEPPNATVALWTDYADYNRFRGDDVAWQTEGYFGMRWSDLGVRALRSGFGIYRGVGGSLEDLDELDKSPRRIGLTYGYLEAEFGFHELVSLLARPVVGLADDGLTGGAQALVRIGNDLGTNLQIGGELLGSVGMRAIAQFELNVLEDWPMMLRSEVTNQPAGSTSSVVRVRPDLDGALPEETSLDANDIGVRGIAQVGYRIADSFVVAIRGSYQGRTINHSGPGFGGALSYSW